jgi:hypothetical protein
MFPVYRLDFVLKAIFARAPFLIRMRARASFFRRVRVRDLQSTLAVALAPWLSAEQHSAGERDIYERKLGNGE